MSMGPHVERDELYADVAPRVEPAPVMPPVVPQPVLQQPVASGVAAAPLVYEQVAQPVAPIVTSVPAVASVRSARVWRFDPAAAIAVVFGIALLLFGLIALVRAGTDGEWSTPVVSVAGFDHTAVLGAIEIGAGLLMMGAGFSGSRAASMFFATVIGVAAFVAAVQSSSFDELAVESSFAWLVVVGAVVVVAAQAFVPTIVDRRSAVRVR